MPTSFDRPPTAALPDDALQEVNRLWTIVRAFSNMAHEVNNALQVISGSAELLEGRNLDPQIQRRVSAIRVHAGTAAARIDELLSYSRDTAAAPARIDMAPLVELAVSMRTGTLNRAQIILKTERSDAAPYWVVADHKSTLQMLLDLLLATEEELKWRRHGRIVVRLQRQAAAVAMVITATADESAGAEEPTRVAPRSSPIDAITTDAQLWVASRLAALQRANLSILRGDASSVAITVAFEPVRDAM